VLEHEEGAGQIDPDHRLPEFQRGLVRGLAAHDAGAGDDGVEAAEQSHRLGDRAAHLVLTAHIAGERVRLRLDVRAGCVERLGTGVGHHDLRALGDEPTGHLETDPARSAGHQGAAPRETLCRRSAGRRHARSSAR